jgi:outer membrane lipoprotein-sorting protein
MKKLVPLGLAIAILVTLVGFNPSNNANAQSAGVVSSILSRLERNRRDMKSLRANISMSKWNSQIRDEDKRNGNLAYVPGVGRNSSVRIEWNSPQEILAVSNGEYTLYRPRFKTAYLGNTARSKGGRANGMWEFLSMSGSQVKTRFENLQDIYDETLWGDVKTTHFKLVPKGNASFKYAEVWMDDSGMIVQTKVIEKNDDATTVRLTNLQRNVGISPDEFRLQLGDDVKKVRG